MATRLTPFWPRPATTSGSLWPGSGLCALYSGPLSGSSHTAAAPLHHKLKRLNSLFHRRLAGDGAGQALEGAGGRQGFFAAQVLDDVLLGAAVLAHGLDEVEVGIAVDALLADEHGRLAAAA